jgi:hypothetical protein
MTDGNPTAAIVDAIDEMVAEDNLTTRSGLKLIIKVFREGMIMVGGMDRRLIEMEQAYIRFTNTNDAARRVEEENQRELASIKTDNHTLFTEVIPEMRAAMRALKWIAGIGTAIITAFLIGLVTGQIQIIRP